VVAGVWYTCRCKLIAHASHRCRRRRNRVPGLPSSSPATFLSESVEWRSGWLVVVPLGAQAFRASAPAGLKEAPWPLASM
jgi:hypothetical protein